VEKLDLVRMLLVHSLKKVLCLLNSRLLSNVIRTLFPSMNTVSHTDGALKDVVDTGVGASPRQLMQFIGQIFATQTTRKIPSIGRNIFCAPVVDKIKSIDYSIITDLRFLHEYTALATAVAERKAILYVVRIERLWWYRRRTFL
jgi:hypothetical protein